jgi:uncharacterized membrane protein YvbJ
MIDCPACGMRTDPQLGNCVHCGRPLAKKSSPLQRKPSESSDTCPNCGAMVRASEVICVTCYTNLVTGKIIPRDEIAAQSGWSQNQKRAAVLAGLSLVTLTLVVAVWLLFLG